MRFHVVSLLYEHTYLNFYVYVEYKWKIERCVKYKIVNMEGEITPQINVQNEGYAK